MPLSEGPAPTRRYRRVCPGAHAGTPAEPCEFAAHCGVAAVEESGSADTRPSTLHVAVYVNIVVGGAHK